jgi:hypothetical protein
LFSYLSTVGTRALALLSLECTAEVMIPTLGAGYESPLSLGRGRGNLSLCCKQFSLGRSAGENGVDSSGEAFLFSRSSTAGNIIIGTRFTFVLVLAAIEFVRAFQLEELASCTNVFVFRRGNQLAVTLGIVACFAGIVEGIFNQRALIIAREEARFAPAALWVTNCKFFESQTIVSVLVLVDIRKTRDGRESTWY